jgi:hypothetical protein
MGNQLQTPTPFVQPAPGVSTLPVQYRGKTLHLPEFLYPLLFRLLRAGQVVAESVWTWIRRVKGPPSGR